MCALFAGAALASPGAIWTSLFNGASVNSNLYNNKEDVYLNGGPNNATGGAGIPDGTYYFMVTDPSGKVLLSTDDISCRQVTVAGGRIDGSTGPACKHANGTASPNKAVQLVPYLDTPNTGGEYKVWVVEVGQYDPNRSNCTFGFCGGDIKTDNFKVMNPTPAYVVACKYNDANGNGVQDLGESVIQGWPVTATGVDGGTVSGQTDSTGCFNFVISTFPAGTVTVTEGTLGEDWVQTSPPNGSVARVGTTPAYTVVNGVLTTNDIKPGDILDIDFGNTNPLCSQPGSCAPPDCILRGQCDNNPGLIVTKDAHPSFRVTWGLAKKVDKTEIDTATSGTANYTVTVTKTGELEFTVKGTITVSNPTVADAGGVNITDAVDNGGSCSLDNGAGVNELINAGETRTFPYTCTYTSKPAVGTNTATATWLSGTVSSNGTATVDFAAATVVDGTVSVSDPMGGGTLGTVSFDQAPKDFTYSATLTGTPGTCVNKPNTATLTSTTPNSTMTPLTADANVKVCMGLDPTVAKTATAAYKRTYSWTVAKAVDKTTVNIAQGGSATFNYTVTATQTDAQNSDWQVTGTITVSNPNDWEAITVNLSDAVPNGGSCTITGGASLTVPASGSASKDYTCTYASAPTANDFVNTATATWNSTTFATPTGSASGTANGTFNIAPTSTVNKTITVKDNFNSGGATTLGTVDANDAAPFATKDFTYSHTVNGVGGTCTDYPNTATISSGDTGLGSASKSVKVCVGKDLTVAKTVNPTFTRTYNWQVSKAVDQTRINTSATSAIFNYTVIASESGFTDGNWRAVGTITVTNPNDWEDVTVTLSDAVNNGGTCNLLNTTLLVPKGQSATANYRCSYASQPSATDFVNTATATWDSAAFFTPTGTANGTANGTFSGAPASTTNKTITVSDNFNGGGAGVLGTVTATDSAPYASQTFTYPRTVNGTAGTCKSYNNTAIIAAGDSTLGSANASVMICVGKDLVVSKTASPAYTRSYTWSIAKSVDNNYFILGGTANYAVTVTEVSVSDSGWTVGGVITVSNPNDWEAVTANLSDAIDNGGACSVTNGTGVSVAANGSATRNYTCTYSGAPGAAAFTNTASASWSGAFTPNTSASGTASGAFTTPTTVLNQTVTVTDTMSGNTITLGQVTANDSLPFATQTFTYARVVPSPVDGCSVINNTARITQTGQTASQSVTSCGLGERTIGYWQNKNGQGVISGANQADLGAWLRQFDPFSDAPSAGIAAYVKNIIKDATCGGTSCIPMLRAQMLGTALSVYFTQTVPNVFGTPIPVGSAIISLVNPENVSGAFGGATSMSIMDMLLYQNGVSDAKGANWYGGNKALQTLAKDAFDNINNGKEVGP